MPPSKNNGLPNADPGHLPDRRESSNPAFVTMKKADPTQFLQKDSFMHVLSFVGPGHFAYVARVSHQWKKDYEESFVTRDEVPKALHGREHRPATRSDTFYGAAFSSVSCAEYWNEDTKEDIQRLAYSRICSVVAKHGNLEVLKWTQQQRIVWDIRTCGEAARNAHLGCLQYAHKKDCPWDEETCAYAAQNGNLDCLKYAHDNGCPWDETT